MNPTKIIAFLISLFLVVSPLSTLAQESPTVTHYPNKYFTAEYSDSGVKITKHIYDDRGNLIATVEGSGSEAKTYYVHTDHLGGTNVVTDDSGEITEVTDYLPYGQINTNYSPAGFTEKRKFTSHIYDPESDLNYMNARYQDGNIGRFLSQDPAFQVVGSPELRQKTNLELDQYLSDPQNMNSYSYVRNNPLKHVDPTGEFVDTVVDIGFIAYDLYKISQAVANGGDVRGELGTLGLDVAGAAIPGVTGLGMIARLDNIGNFGSRIIKNGDDFSALGKYAGTQHGINLTKAADQFSENNVSITEHALERVIVHRSAEGINAPNVIDTFKSGELFFDTRHKNYVRFKDGIRVSIDKNDTIRTVVKDKNFRNKNNRFKRVNQ